MRRLLFCMWPRFKRLFVRQFMKVARGNVLSSRFLIGEHPISALKTKSHVLESLIAFQDVKGANLGCSSGKGYR